MKWTFNRELTLESFTNHEELTLSYLYFEQEEINKEYINFETLREISLKNVN